MFILNGKPVNIYQDLTIGEGEDSITYPASSLTSPSLREELGITEIKPETPEYNPYYIIVTKPNGDKEKIFRPLSQLKQGKLLEINTKALYLMSMVKVGIPEDEVSSWSEQKAEAKAYLADKNQVPLLLTALAEQRSMNLDTLVEKVMAKANAYTEYLGKVIGTRQKLEDALDLITEDMSQEEKEVALENIKWV